MSGILLAWLAVIGGDVHVGDGTVIPGATVLIDGDRIASIGIGSEVPEGAVRIGAKGKIITPGFIDAFTRLGLVEIGGVAASNDVDSGKAGPIRASQRAVDSFNPDSTVLPIQRSHGITAALSSPGGGLISGQAAVVGLDGVIIRTPAAMVAGWGGRGGGSRGASIAQLREVLEDARLYARHPDRFDQNRMRALAASRLDLAAMRPVLEGKLPLMVNVNRRSDVLTALRLAAEEKLSIILVGAREAWLERERIARAGVPVILDPSANLPRNFDGVRSRHDAAVLLVKAGVRVALSTFSTHNVRKLRQWAGNAVRSGLSPAQALEAVTRTPAHLLGLSDRGELKPGKIADLVIWSGDPFELSTRADTVIIGGREMSEKHRQRQLFDRYRRLKSAR